MSLIQDKIQSVVTSIESLKEYAISGDINSHEAFAIIKQANIIDYLKEEINKIESDSIDVLERSFIDFGKKSFKDDFYSYTIKNGSTRYYFTDVKEVKEKKKLLEQSKEYFDLKSTEAKYKTAFMLKQKGQAVFDEETGEEIDVSKVNVVYSKNSLIIKSNK